MLHWVIIFNFRFRTRFVTLLCVSAAAKSYLLSKCVHECICAVSDIHLGPYIWEDTTDTLLYKWHSGCTNAGHMGLCVTTSCRSYSYFLWILQWHCIATETWPLNVYACVQQVLAWVFRDGLASQTSTEPDVGYNYIHSLVDTPSLATRIFIATGTKPFAL